MQRRQYSLVLVEDGGKITLNGGLRSIHVRVDPKDKREGCQKMIEEYLYLIVILIYEVIPF